MNLIIPANWRKNVSVRVIAKLTWSPRAFQYRFHFYGWRSIPICKASSVKGKHISYIIRYKKSKRRWKQISSTFPSSHNASTWRCLNKNKKIWIQYSLTYAKARCNQFWFIFFWWATVSAKSFSVSTRIWCRWCCLNLPVFEILSVTYHCWCWRIRHFSLRIKSWVQFSTNQKKNKTIF